MLSQFAEPLSEARARVERMRDYLDLDNAERKVQEIEAQFGSGQVWENNETVRRLTQELNQYKTIVQQWQELSEALEEAEVVADVASPDIQEEIDEAQHFYLELMHRLERAETISLLNGPYDRAAAIVTLHAGAGGVDAQDWTEMLLRMYMRWAETEGYKVTLAEYSPAEEDGIHSASFIVEGFFPFGMLSSEHGVHRLVRISPYDAAHRRHTSFAKVEVVPELAEESDIELRPEDLKIDTYRSQGAGGQHVNKTESAVRITHIPTGTVAACQNERSQHSNKETALRMLKSKLLDLKREQRQDTLDNVKGENREAAWANQIRNYVVHPYTMVKDRRTGFENADVNAVLRGDLEGFMHSWLQARARLGREPQTNDSL
ncbi:MAG: peptide chain release factor 2 [Candidatus Bruticola sp.]